jgi:cyclopropane fatty-acyl-phospholipid synthase-like methyltransferase
MAKKNMLTENKYWENIYVSYNLNIPRLGKNQKLFFKLLSKFLKKDKNKLMIEIGSAPGKNLYYFNKFYNFKVYGVEYTTNGYQANKALFKKYNINGVVIHSDFLDINFQKKYYNFFDLVSSFGFIEHFNNPKLIIENHLSLLKKEGLIVITIPNLTGINYYFNYFFNKDLFEIHNLNIMKLKNFKKLFDNEELEILYCNYFGDFTFTLFNTNNPIKLFILRIGYLTEFIFNFFFSLFLNKKNYSPFLLLIAKKR